jgi:hypothetical protein
MKSVRVLFSDIMLVIVSFPDFECILRLDNRQPVRCDQYDLMKNVMGNKKLDIPEGCERLVNLLNLFNQIFS